MFVGKNNKNVKFEAEFISLTWLQRALYRPSHRQCHQRQFQYRKQRLQKHTVPDHSLQTRHSAYSRCLPCYQSPDDFTSEYLLRNNRYFSLLQLVLQTSNSLLNV